MSYYNNIATKKKEQFFIHCPNMNNEQKTVRRISMKVKNLNRSSEKTKRIIKKVFAEMLSEYREISKISVRELCERADISRSTFYAHYDDTYGIAEDYENELIDRFFDNTKLVEAVSEEKFAEIFFQYIRENDENYKLLCRSNDFLFAAKKLTAIVVNKLLELCNRDKRIKNKEYLALDISVFVNGLLCEYVKYCRRMSMVQLDSMYAFTKIWMRDFLERRSTSPACESTPLSDLKNS